MGLWLSWAGGCCLEHRAPSSRDSSSGWASAWHFKDCPPVRWGTASSESISGPCTQTEHCQLAPKSGRPKAFPTPLVVGTPGHPHQQGSPIVTNCTLALHMPHSPPSSQLPERSMSQDKGRSAPPPSDMPWCLPTTRLPSYPGAPNRPQGQKGPESELILEVGISAFAKF